MKIIEMAKDIKPGEKVLDTGTSFVVKEIRVHLEHGLIAFLDTEDVGHGYYHPDEYLGVGEDLSRKYAATFDWHYSRAFRDDSLTALRLSRGLFFVHPTRSLECAAVSPLKATKRF